MFIKSLIFLFAIALVLSLPRIRVKESKLLNKAYCAVLIFNLIGAYYGFVSVVFTRISILSDIFLLALLSAAVSLTSWKRSLRVSFYVSKIAAMVGTTLRRVSALSLNRSKTIFFLLVALHVVSLIFIYFVVRANPYFQGADIVEGRFGSRSYIHNSFPYLKYSLLWLCFLFVGELSTLLYYGVIRRQIRYLYGYLGLILVLVSFTTAANFKFFVQRDQWRHASAVYSLLQNDAYRIWYLGEDITDDVLLGGALPLPKRFLIGTATSYASNYGFYYFLASAFGIVSFHSLVLFYQLFHPLWWQFSMIVILFFLLKTIEEFSDRERFLMLCIGLVSIYGLTMANVNFPQYTTAPIFLIFLETFVYAVIHKRQYFILFLAFFALLFSYASYVLLFIAFAPLMYYWFSRKGVQRKKSILCVWSAFAASALAVFTYYLGNFNGDLLYSFAEFWKPAKEAFVEMLFNAFTGAYFFNSRFVIKIFIFPFTPPLLWKTLMYGVAVSLMGLLIIKTKKITALHLLAGVTLFTYSFMFKISAGENLLVQRLWHFIGFLALLTVGYACARGIEETKFYYRKLLIIGLIAGYSGLSFLSFINIVHSTNTMAYSLIRTFYERYGDEATNGCFVADDADLVVLEAVSGQNIREGNFPFSDSRFTKNELIGIRDSIVFKENKQPLLEYQKKYGIKTCYAMNSYEHFPRLRRLFGAPLLRNDLFAIWESTL